MTDYLDNDNKTNLLFKQFQGVAQTAVITDDTVEIKYQNEPKSKLTNIFQSDIFSEDVPLDLSSTLLNLYDDISIVDSSWNTNINDQSINYIDISNTPLRFYKKLYLAPTNGTNQAWWLSSGNFTSQENILKDMIPFLYNGNNPNMYTPIVEYWDGSQWLAEDQGTSNSLNWSIDYATGILQLNQNDSILNTKNINKNQGITIETSRPRISFIKYIKSKGSGSGGGSGSGLIKVGESSGGIPQSSGDVSAIFFDVNGFDVSINNQTAIITNKGGSSGSSTDLSSIFFNIPLAPTDGSGVLNTSIGTGTIVLQWKNPYQNQAALPFGSYLTYPEGSTNEALVQNDKLPFHRHLHIEYLPYVNGSPSGEWIDVSINNPNQTVIPNTITEAYFTSQLGSTVDLCSNTGVAPFNRLYTDQLELGKGYQFRIYLDNSGTNVPVPDPIHIGTDVSWNYLYIPSGSGDFISLGSFGMAAPPTLSPLFLNETYDEFDIQLRTDGVADVCLNTPFPISDALPLTYRFAVTVSGEIDPSSIQMPNQQYSGTFHVDISSDFQKNGSVRFNYDGAGIGVSNSLVGLDISAAPSFRYRLVNYFGVNSAYDTSFAFAVGLSDETLLPIPTRSAAIEASDYRAPLKNGSINFPTPDVSLANAYPNNSGSIINNIWFLDTITNVSTSVNPNLKMGNNLGPGGANTGGLIGKTSIDMSLSYFKTQVENTGYLYSEDTSNNPTIGYLDVSSSNLDSSRFKITNQASEAGKTPDFQNKGFYTKIDVSELEIKNITLANYPDICNNSYQNYTYKLSQFYNDSSASLNYTESNFQTYNFNIGKKPEEDVSYNLIGYKNSEATLDNYFFGLRRPNVTTNIPVDFSFNLSQLNPDWRRSTTLSTNSLVYDNPQVGGNVSSNSTSWPTGGVTDLDITPISNIPITYLKSTQKYNRTNTETLPQFIVKSTYSNNVLRSPSTYDISQQIAFGTNSKPLWWDFTYETTPTGTSATNINTVAGFSTINSMNYLGGGINPGTSTYPTDTSSTPGGFFNQYSHQVQPYYNQLIWANGGFRCGKTQPPLNNPYIDFSASFYNPNQELKDYSNLDISGDFVSYTIPAGEYYDSSIFTSVDISNNYKWINLEITNIDKVYLTITVKQDSTTLTRGPESEGGDYLIYICEENSLYTTGGGYTYNGRSGWLDTQKTKTAASNTAAALDGAGCFEVGIASPKISLIQASASNTSTVYLRIGLPEEHLNRYISSVTFTNTSS